jgi:tetratricopeptide (TPR) repeat protein
VRWAVALAILLCACGHRKRPPKPPLFPELERVDAALVHELRPQVMDSWTETPPRIRPKGGVEAGWAILKILVEQYEGDVWRVSTSWPDRDPYAEAPAMRIGELADAELRAALRRGLAATELHYALRRKLAIALCREGDVASVEALVDRAIDRREVPDVREAILERLHRTRAKPPRRLRDALYLPFCGLDRVAAATLARMGDPEAPSLVLEGLEAGCAPRHLVAASIAITGKGEEYPECLVVPDGEDFRAVDRRAIQPHVDALREWTRVPRTEFERERRAYLDGGRRRRELAILTFDDIRAAGDDFDLASAILLATGDKRRETTLERLDRLARFARRRIDGIADPEARILALNEALLHGRMVWEAAARESGTVSRLDHVLESDTGNCLGWSSLYLAVGERCGLALRAVRAPGHMLVRYDDGTFRRNIETTALGKARSDESYREGAIGTSDLAPRQVVADALNSAACTAAYHERYDEACDLVGEALALDPDFGMACLNRAKFTFHSRLDADETVIADIERALSLHSDPAGCRRAAGDLLVSLGRVERALVLYTEADAIEPSPSAKAGRADCLSLLGRIEESKSAAGDEVPLFLSVRLAPDQAHSAVVAAGSGVDTCYRVAYELLRLQPPRDAQALELVDQAIGELDGRGGAFPDTAEWVAENRIRRNLLALRAKALAGLKRHHDAGVALENASKLKGSNRLLLESRAYVERLATEPTGR